MKQLEDIEREINKVCNLLNWLIIEPSAIDTPINCKGVWAFNKLRLIAVKKWVNQMECQIDGNLDKEILKEFKDLEKMLCIVYN